MAQNKLMHYPGLRCNLLSVRAYRHYFTPLAIIDDLLVLLHMCNRMKKSGIDIKGETLNWS